MSTVILGITLGDEQRNTGIRRRCKIEDIVRWMKKKEMMASSCLENGLKQAS